MYKQSNGLRLNPGRKEKYFTELNVITFKLKCVTLSLILQNPAVFKNGLSKFGVHQQTYLETPTKCQAPYEVLAMLTVSRDTIPVHLPILFSQDSHEKILLGSWEEANLEWRKTRAEKPGRKILK